MHPVDIMMVLLQGVQFVEHTAGGLLCMIWVITSETELFLAKLSPQLPKAQSIVFAGAFTTVLCMASESPHRKVKMTIIHPTQECRPP